MQTTLQLLGRSSVQFAPKILSAHLIIVLMVAVVNATLILLSVMAAMILQKSVFLIGLLLAMFVNPTDCQALRAQVMITAAILLYSLLTDALVVFVVVIRILPQFVPHHLCARQTQALDNLNV